MDLANERERGEIFAMAADLVPSPPMVPHRRAPLERAIILLGCRAAGDLRASKRVELISLIGAYPDAKTATAWKSTLKRLRADEIFETAG
jgi:hypothetical protein